MPGPPLLVAVKTRHEPGVRATLRTDRQAEIYRPTSGVGLSTLYRISGCGRI